MPGQCRGTPSFHASTPSPSPSASPLPSPWKSEVHKQNPKEGGKWKIQCSQKQFDQHWMSQRSGKAGQDGEPPHLTTIAKTTDSLCCRGNEFCFVWVRASN